VSLIVVLLVAVTDGFAIYQQVLYNAEVEERVARLERLTMPPVVVTLPVPPGECRVEQ
jgi:hypothetical protein